MFKTLATLTLLAVVATTAMAQAPAKVPVALKPEAYTELDKIQEQLAKAKEAEALAQATYEAKASMRIALEQALQVAVLKALMAVGVTDPSREIAAPPKAP